MKTTKQKLLIGTLLSGAMMATVSVPTFAQDSGADEVVVTGSRIKRDSNLDSSIPVATLGAIELENTSAFNAAELIRELPQAGVPGLSSSTTNFSVFSAGLETVDLRNLGDSRTLTLMDGRRLVPGVPGSSAVDFSMIPPEFIEKIDVVTGGASSVYGSEAIAGVVNVILKDDFQGVELSGRAGVTESKSGFTGRMGLTAGSTFSEDRGNVIVNFGYDYREGIKATDTEYQTDNFAIASGDFVLQPLYSTYPPQGRYSVDGSSDLTISDSGQVIPWSRDLGFNRQENRRLLVPQERYSAALKGEYSMSDWANLSFSALYADVSSDSDIEPFPLASDDIYNPNGTVVGAGVPITNPLIPDDIRSVMIANSDDTLEFVRRMREVSDREGRYDRSTIDLALGLDGDIPFLSDHDLSYDVYANYGKSTSIRNGAGQVNVQNMRFGLDVIEDPLSPGSYVCRDATARAFGCVPVDIFGSGAISPGAAAYISAPGSRNAETVQSVVSGTVTGNLFKVPAGNVGFAVGAEYRDMESADIVDALTAAGLNAGNAIESTIGEFDVTEFFGEILVPIVKDAGFLNDLNFEGAYRHADYSTVGGNESWKAGLTASVWDRQVKLRAVQARAARAPNIDDLFGGNAQSFSDTADPCAGINGSNQADYAAGCLTLPGVVSAIAANPANGFLYDDLDIQSQYFFSSGSELLKPEVSDSLTVGIVFTPSGAFNGWLDGFTASVDYVDFEIKDAITTFSRDRAAEECIDGGNNPNDPLCQLVVRDPVTSKILYAYQVPINAAVFKTDAIDFQVKYAGEVPFLDNAGDFDVRLLWTNTLNYEFQADAAIGDSVDYMGDLYYPYNRANFQANWYKGNFSLNWRTLYIGDQEIDAVNPDGCDVGLLAFYNSIGLGSASESFCYTPGTQDYFEHGMTARYMFEDINMDFYAGVDNLTDEFVYIPGGFNGNVTGTETAGDVFDAEGRRFYIGFKKRW